MFEEKQNNLDESITCERRIKASSALYQIHTFLMSLAKADVNGRILISRKESNDVSSNGQSSLQRRVLPTMKYLLVNPADSFASIVDEARSIVFAGGTMEPIQDVIDVLLPKHIPIDTITRFSCGHVIPKSNLIGLSIHSGPTGKSFEFVHGSKNDWTMVFSFQV